MTISELQRPTPDDAESALDSRSGGEQVDAVSSAADESPSRRGWRLRRKGTGGPAGPPDAGEAPDRFSGDLYRLGSKLSQPSPQESRLRARLAVATRELEVLAADRTTKRQPWAKAASALLGDTQAALEAGQVTEGWQLLRAAERQMIEGRDVDEVGDDLVAVRRRLQALAPEAAEALPARSPKDPESLRAITQRAHAILDGYLDELERLVHQKARMLGQVGVLLASMLILGGVIVLFDFPIDVDGTVMSNLRTYVTIAGLGVAGAIVSRAVLGDGEEGYLVQTALNPVLIHVLKLSLGGLAAVAALLFLQSDLQGVVTVVGFTTYPIAFAAGFAERFVDPVFARTERSCEAMAARAVGIDEN